MFRPSVFNGEAVAALSIEEYAARVAAAWQPLTAQQRRAVGLAFNSSGTEVAA